MADGSRFFRGANGKLYITLQSLEQDGTTAVSGPGVTQQSAAAPPATVSRGERTSQLEATRNPSTQASSSNKAEPAPPAGHAEGDDSYVVTRHDHGPFRPLYVHGRVRYVHPGTKEITDRIPENSNVSFSVTKQIDPILFRSDLDPRTGKRARVSSKVARFRAVDRDSLDGVPEPEEFYIDEHQNVFTDVPEGCVVVTSATATTPGPTDGTLNHPVVSKESGGYAMTIGSGGHLEFWRMQKDGGYQRGVSVPVGDGVTFEPLSTDRLPARWKMPKHVVRVMVRETSGVNSYYVDQVGFVYSDLPEGAEVLPEKPGIISEKPVSGLETISDTPPAETEDSRTSLPVPEVHPAARAVSLANKRLQMSRSHEETQANSTIQGDVGRPADFNWPVPSEPLLAASQDKVDAEALRRIIRAANERRMVLDRVANRAPRGWQGIALSSSDAYRRLYRARTATKESAAGGHAGYDFQIPFSFHRPTILSTRTRRF